MMGVARLTPSAVLVGFMIELLLNMCGRKSFEDQKTGARSGRTAARAMPPLTGARLGGDAASIVLPIVGRRSMGAATNPSWQEMSATGRFPKRGARISSRLRRGRHGRLGSRTAGLNRL